MLNDESKASLRVLIVEDEALVAIILEDMLIELGHEVIGPVSTPGEGLEHAARTPVDLAILDLNLKGASSLPIAVELDKRGIPLIFSTGYGRGGLPAVFAQAPLLQKPFQQSDVESVIAGAVAERSRGVL